MSKRIGLSTKEYLTNASLPQQTESYTVIPHGAVMTATEKILAEKGFSIEREMYKCTVNAQVAQGVYHLKYGSDPEMSMLVAWSNSYDKTMRFKFAVGGYIHSSSSAMLSQTIGNWNRKHTGTADQETERTIREQLEDADKHYAQLVADKECMKLITLDSKRVGEIVGRLYLEKNILNTEQLSVIKAQLKQPSFDYNAPIDSLWALYNHIAYSLQRAHPKAWMDQQRLIHYFICQEFDLTPTVNAMASEVKEEVVAIEGVNKQLDLVDIIYEVEREEAAINALPEIALENISLTTPQVVSEEVRQELVSPVYAEAPILGPERLETTMEFEQRSSGMSVLDTPELDISTWNCLDCGEEQGSDAVFYDGQLCGRCHSKQNGL